MFPVGVARDGAANPRTIRSRTFILTVKILLDECVPWPLRSLLVGHECQTPMRCGWGGWKNGELLLRAEGKFECFITSDQNLRYQQNLRGRAISILELSTNKWRRIRAAADDIRSAVNTIAPGEYRRLEIP